MNRIGILYKEHLKWKEFQRWQNMKNLKFELVTPHQTVGMIFMPEVTKGFFSSFGKAQERSIKLNIV